MVMVVGKHESLRVEDWTEAALHALGRGGLAAVAVEPLAKSLGTTKGSFYWHFADRNALLEATLRLWERRATDLVLAGIDQSSDAETRLRTLLRLAFLSVRPESARSDGAIELALQASTSHPLVAATLARVTSRRVAALTGLYTDLGLTRVGARDRALLAYTSFLGHAQLARATPELLPRGRAFTRHVDQVVDTLVGSPVRA
jgi:AcrR family transcriptional regulator